MTAAVLAEADGDGASGRAEPSWQRWHRRAVGAAVGDELAALGRELMREASHRRWSEEARIASGGLDDGNAMIRLALTDPERADRIWSHMLETCGEVPRM